MDLVHAVRGLYASAHRATAGSVPAVPPVPRLSSGPQPPKAEPLDTSSNGETASTPRVQAQPRTYDEIIAAGAITALPDEHGTWPHGEPAMDDTWDNCMGAYIEALPEAARQRVSHALWIYASMCDKVERRIVFGPPGPVPAGRHYTAKSYAMFAGQLAKGRNKVWLRLQYLGWSWIFAKRVTIAADDYRWRSPPLVFRRDNYADDVWEIVDLPLTRPLLLVIHKLVDAKESIIRFEGDHHYNDLVVTPEMKQDLKLMMDALAALGLP